MRALPRWWELLLAPLALLWPQAHLAAADTPPAPAAAPAPAAKPAAHHRPPLPQSDNAIFLHALERCERDPARALDVRAARLFERLGPKVLRQVLIVTVPDPVDSSFGEGFDATVSAVGAALAAVGYASGEYSLPWLDHPSAGGDKSGAEGRDAPSSRCIPGILVFRRGASDAGDKRSDVVLVLLVGETPAWGVHVNALGQALTFAAKSGAPGERVRILGPSFSGSAASLRATLDEWAAAQGEHAPAFEIITGGATAPTTADELRTPRIDFSATVVPDNVQTCAMYRFLAHRLDISMDDVALFVESNTAFGDFFKEFQCARQADVPGPPLRPRIIVPFPLHIAELRAAEEKQRKPSDGKSDELAAGELAGAGSPLDLRIDQGRQSMDNLPAFAPDLTAPGTQLELTEILGNAVPAADPRRGTARLRRARRRRARRGGPAPLPGPDAVHASAPTASCITSATATSTACWWRRAIRCTPAPPAGATPFAGARSCKRSRRRARRASTTRRCCCSTSRRRSSTTAPRPASTSARRSARRSGSRRWAATASGRSPPRPTATATTTTCARSPGSADAETVGAPAPHLGAALLAAGRLHLPDGAGAHLHLHQPARVRRAIEPERAAQPPPIDVGLAGSLPRGRQDARRASAVWPRRARWRCCC